MPTVRKPTSYKSWEDVKDLPHIQASIRCSPLEYWAWSDPVEVEQMGLSGLIRYTVNHYHSREFAEIAKTIGQSFDPADTVYDRPRKTPYLEWDQIKDRSSILTSIYLFPVEYYVWTRAAQKRGLSHSEFVGVTMDIKYLDILQDWSKKLNVPFQLAEYLVHAVSVA